MDVDDDDVKHDENVLGISWIEINGVRKKGEKDSHDDVTKIFSSSLTSSPFFILAYIHEQQNIYLFPDQRILFASLILSDKSSFYLFTLICWIIQFRLLSLSKHLDLYRGWGTWNLQIEKKTICFNIYYLMENIFFALSYDKQAAAVSGNKKATKPDLSSVH